MSKFLHFRIATLFTIILIGSSCEYKPMKSRRVQFETLYIETIKQGNYYSNHETFYDFSQNYVKATINFHPSNLYGSLGVECDGDWNKTMGFMMPGTIDPHSNSGRFAHRVSADFEHLELGYYVHRKGDIYIRDAEGVVTGTTWVEDLVSGYIMDIEVSTNYLVEIVHEPYLLKFYVADSLVKTVDIPYVPSGGYDFLHFYHGGNCPAPQDISLNITYHQNP